jgi:hypothetical protein
MHEWEYDRMTRKTGTGLNKNMVLQTLTLLGHQGKLVSPTTYSSRESQKRKLVNTDAWMVQSKTALHPSFLALASLMV